MVTLYVNLSWFFPLFPEFLQINNWDTVDLTLIVAKVKTRAKMECEFVCWGSE